MSQWLNQFKQKFFTVQGLLNSAFILSLIGVSTLIFDYGFNQDLWLQLTLNGFYFGVIILGIVATLYRHYRKSKRAEWKVLIFDFVTIAFSLFIIGNHLKVELTETKAGFFYTDLWMNLSVFLTFVREFAERKVKYKRKAINPAQLFIVSFVVIILLGALLLQLPNATTQGISFIDALFTSTSAVCVTGLIVVDTATYFTEFGQIIIVLLIQIGGLGILTFASYFSYFFKGDSSYENQLSLGELTNSQKLGEVFSTLKRILIITFTVEFIGGVFIFTSLDPGQFDSFFGRAFFSIFHSVSAFCNAGFSTFTAGLFDSSVRFNYWLQMSIIFLFVMGGLGFPIVVNILKYTKYFIINKVLFFMNKVQTFKPWVLNLNTRITLITTISLTVIGTIGFYLCEYNNSLVDHNEFGKIVTSLFGATTPRTAGFNTVDMATLNFSTLMLTIFLMWIGASPASTGGGIKTSTFAIATLNFIALAKGKTRIEVYRREISDLTVRRAFATIALSLMIIGFGIFLISIFDRHQDLLSISVECFSAYSTVGLSVGITGELSSYSKLVLIFIMFIGRVSMLTILIAVFRKVKHKNYRYPSEEITIN